MSDYVLKDFRLKCSLKEKATGKWLGVKEIVVQGYNGSGAVWNFQDKLRKEGKYEMDESYSYFEIGPSKI